jgi:alpha-glucosidase (family GH31 glycosyl hydrolase)
VFIKTHQGENLKALVWPGWCVFPDFTAQKTRAWWGQYYQRLLDQGIAGIWHDMNEPAAFAAWGEPTLSKSALHELEGIGRHTPGSPQFVRFSDESRWLRSIERIAPRQTTLDSYLAPVGQAHNATPGIGLEIR